MKFKKFVEGYARMRPINQERYTNRENEGLEGPFQTTSGQVYYYSRREGRNWNPDTDQFISDEDFAKMDARDNLTWHDSPLTDPQSKHYQHMKRKGLI